MAVSITTEPVDFEALVREGQPAVTRYLLARTGSAAEAAELAQETFVRAYCAMSKGDRPRRPLPWLLAIARNVFLEALRSARYQRQLTARMGQLMGMEELLGRRENDLRRVNASGDGLCQHRCRSTCSVPPHTRGWTVRSTFTMTWN